MLELLDVYQLQDPFFFLFFFFFFLFYSFCTVVGGILMCMWPKNKGAPSFSSPSPSPFANGKQLQMGGVQWVLNLDDLLQNSCKKILLLLRDLRITLRWVCQVHTRVLLFFFFF
jgi:hypothetical protein